MSQQRLQKGLERGRIEHCAQGVDELASAYAYGPGTGDRLAGGRMEPDRILDLRRRPHVAPGAMLLEMAFIHAPEFNAPAPCQRCSFFYNAATLTGSDWGTWGLGFRSQTPCGQKALALAHPQPHPVAPTKIGHEQLTVPQMTRMTEFFLRLTSFPSAAHCLVVSVARYPNAPHRASRSVHGFQNASLSATLSADLPQTSRRPAGNCGRW